MPAAALFQALLPLPYGYYDLLRLLVTTAAALIAWKEYDLGRNVGSGKVNNYALIFVAFAHLYNPILPIHLTKLIWMPIDVVTALVFIGDLWAKNRHQLTRWDWSWGRWTHHKPRAPALAGAARACCSNLSPLHSIKRRRRDHHRTFDQTLIVRTEIQKAEAVCNRELSYPPKIGQ